MSLLVWLPLARAQEQISVVPGTPCVGVRIQNGNRGAEILEVFPGFPADLAALRKGDQIVSVDGRAVISSDAFATLITTGYRIGDRVDLEYTRGERRYTATVVLDRFPDNTELFRRRLLGRAAPTLPGAAPGQVLVVLFVGQNGRDFGCSGPCQTLWDRVTLLAKSRMKGLGVTVVAGSGPPVSQRGLSVVKDTAGVLHDAFHVGEQPALIVIDRDGWVRFAETGPGLELTRAQPAIERALESQNGVPL